MSITDRASRLWTRVLKGRLLIVFSGLFLSLCMGYIHSVQPVFLQYLEKKLFDTYLQSMHRTQTSGVPVIVDIDEKTLKEFGQWPWPRYLVASLMQKVQSLGASSIGLDFVFAEPDRTSLDVLKQEMNEFYQLNVKILGVPEFFQDNDKIFADVLANGPFILGYHFNYEATGREQRQCVLHQINQAFRSEDGTTPDVDYFISAPDVTCNIPVLSEAIRSSGSFNTIPDEDGIIRSQPLFFRWKENLYPSLALATYLKGRPVTNLIVGFANDGVASLQLDDLVIPLDQAGRMLINMRGPQRTFPYYSARDVLRDILPRDTFKDKIVFVGTSAAGLKDLRATALDSVYPGVEVHATIVDNILQRDFLSLPRQKNLIQYLLILFLGGLATALLAQTSAIWSLLPLSLCAAGLWYGTRAIFAQSGLFISPLLPLMTLAAIFAMLTLIKFWREELEKRFYHSAFSHYVSKAVVDQIVKSPEKLSLSGEERDVSILFSDIRSFTTLSEQLSPNQVSELLHAYFTPMTRRIIAHEGTLDKFIGDAVMAFWNAPLDIVEHQRKAVAASFEMLTELATLNQSFKTAYNLELKIGIGLHSGQVRVGNMGSADLFDYTIIGDNVNVASRLEGLTKYYGQEIIVSESIRNACGDVYFFLEIDTVRVKGRVLPLIIYRPFPLAEAKAREEEFSCYARALEHYKQQHFSEAQRLFVELREGLRDAKLYAIYQERCKTLQSLPPPTDWDHVFTHEEK